jgi:thiosulfate reductase/polysulfide reductase chain A
MVGFIKQAGIKSSTTPTNKTTPGIRIDSVFMAHGYGSANPLMSVGVNAGVDDTSLITKITVDPETGAHGMRNNFVKLTKDGKVIDIPAAV